MGEVRSMKKMLSLVLALAMVLTAVSAFAEIDIESDGKYASKQGETGYKAAVKSGSSGDSLEEKATYVVNITNINVDSSINNSYNQMGTTSLVDRSYTLIDKSNSSTLSDKSSTSTLIDKSSSSTLSDKSSTSTLIDKSSSSTMSDKNYSYTLNDKNYSYTLTDKSVENVTDTSVENITDKSVEKTTD